MKVILERSDTTAPKHLPVHIYWKSCAPFVVNARGKLVHRVKSVTQFDKLEHGTHIHADYWCGSGANSKLKSMNLHFVEYPSGEDILCARCEEAAVASGRPSAHELTGYHVHTGSCTAKAHCHPVEF